MVSYLIFESSFLFRNFVNLYNFKKMLIYVIVYISGPGDTLVSKDEACSSFL